MQGCDASIMIVNSNGDYEWRNTANQSLKPDGFQAILSAKAAVDSNQQCQYKVSCADIMALAAREAVYLVCAIRQPPCCQSFVATWSFKKNKILSSVTYICCACNIL